MPTTNTPPTAIPSYDDTAEHQALDWYQSYANAQRQRAERLKPQLTAQQLEQQRQRARRQASTLDAINAIGNLLWTTRNSGNLRDPNNTIDHAVKDRYDYLIAQRNNQETAWLNALDKASAGELNYHRARSAAAQSRYQRDLASANLQAKQDANALTRQYNADRLAQQQANADRNYNLAQSKETRLAQSAKDQANYRNRQLNIAQQNATSRRISANNGGNGGHSGNGYTTVSVRKGKDVFGQPTTTTTTTTKTYGKGNGSKPNSSKPANKKPNYSHTKALGL